MRRRFGEIWPQNLYGSTELVLHRRWHQKAARQTNSTAISRGQTNRHQTKSVLQSVPPSIVSHIVTSIVFELAAGRPQPPNSRATRGPLLGWPFRPAPPSRQGGGCTNTHTPVTYRCIETLHCCRGPGFMPTGRVCGATAGCEATPAGGGVWPTNRATNTKYRTARKSGGPGGGSS